MFSGKNNIGVAVEHVASENSILIIDL